MNNWEFEAGSFSTKGVREAFRVWGFVIIRNALTAQEVGAVRAELNKAFSEPHLADLPTLCSTEVLKREPIWRALFKDGIVGPLRAALGPELYYQHDMDVQRNSYGLTGMRRNTGWHMDAGSETGNAYLRHSDYRFAKCGIYLQDFDNGWGGGIRVKRKSHRGLFEGNALKRRYFALKRALNRVVGMIGMDVDTFEVPTRAGDLCFFDSRLLHSSVPPARQNATMIGFDSKQRSAGFWQKIPADHTKYVIYWDACNAAMVADFLRNSIKRAGLEAPGMVEEPHRPAVFSRLLSVRYPEDFPAAFADAASSMDVGIASLGDSEARHYKDKLRTMQLLHP